MRRLGQEGARCFEPAVQVQVEDPYLLETPRTAGFGLPVAVASAAGRRTHCDVYVDLPVGTGDSSTDWQGARLSLYAESGGILSLLAEGDVTNAALNEVLDGSSNVIRLRGILFGVRNVACDAFHLYGKVPVAASITGGHMQLEVWGDGV